MCYYSPIAEGAGDAAPLERQGARRSPVLQHTGKTKIITYSKLWNFITNLKLLIEHTLFIYDK